MGTRTIGEAARELGVSIDTLRLYERRELLLAPVKRDAADRRSYDDDDLEWIQTCLYLRGTGMSLADIGRYAALVRAGDGTEEQRLALLRTHLDGVTRRLAEVQGWADAVAHKVRYYEALVDGSSLACSIA
jgi:DNA-binding transcriptional MerR regulator